MPSCAVASCSNTHLTRISAVTNKVLRLHRFPNNDAVAKRWIEACNRKDQLNLKNAVVCGEHFRYPEDYERNLKAELLGLSIPLRLKADAVPRLHLSVSTEFGNEGRGEKRKLDKDGVVKGRRGKRINRETQAKDDCVSTSGIDNNCLSSSDLKHGPDPPPNPHNMITLDVSCDSKINSTSPAVLIPYRGNCLICYTPCPRKESSSSRDENFPLMTKHLIKIFIFLKVFELSVASLEKYLSSCPEPDKWIGFCDVCSQSVKKCWKIYNDLLETCNKFKKAKKEMIGTLVSSVVKNKRPTSRFPSITNESRQFVYERNYDFEELTNPFEEGDQIAKQMAHDALNSGTFKTAIIASKPEVHLKLKPVDHLKSRSGLFQKTTYVYKGVAQKSIKINKRTEKSNPFLNLFHNLNSMSAPLMQQLETVNLGGCNGDVETSVKEQYSEAEDGEYEAEDEEYEAENGEYEAEDEEYEAENGEYEAENISEANDKLEEDQLELEKKVDRVPRQKLPKTTLPLEDLLDLKPGTVILDENDDDDGYAWEVEDGQKESEEEELDADGTYGEIGSAEIQEITCPLCGTFKCKVSKGEVLCQHLESCVEPREPSSSLDSKPYRRKDKVLVCPVCLHHKSTIEEKVSFAEHIAVCKEENLSSTFPEVPLNSRIFRCIICSQKKFLKMNRFAVHYLHHKQMSRVDCVKCSAKFCSSSSFHSHWYKKHVNLINTVPKHSRYRKVFRLPSIPWWCPICNEKCASEDLRNAHVASFHSDSTDATSTFSTSHKCSECEKSYYSKSELKLHNATTHISESRFFYCEVCFEVFQNLRLLRMHKMRIHNLGFHCCTICRKKYSSRRTLEKHLESHKDEAKSKLTCSKCQKMYSSSTALAHHVSAVHKKIVKYCCQVCGRPFCELTNFKRHMAGVHKVGTWKSKIFPCPLEGCSRKLRSREQLTCHLSQHKKDPQYKCSYCGQDFYFPEKLKRHELRHTTPYEDWPFQCHVCAKKYLRRDLLRMHLRTHGPNYTPPNPTKRKLKEDKNRTYSSAERKAS